jgi:chemosensory pili system protein ChpA (sensor histidine kinase/response regulator)
MSTVLVVDDDPKFLEALHGILTEAGYLVLQAGDGQEAVDLVELMRRDISLIIVDLALPVVNGFEIIGVLSRRPIPVKIIATSGIYNDHHLEVAATLGAHAVIRKSPEGKPLPKREWLATVRRLIGGQESENRAQAAGEDSEPSNGRETNI